MSASSGSDVRVGDCLAVMPTFNPDSVDAIVTDPPYGIGFMGKAWDHGVPGAEFWTAALRVAKPGAHLAAFGGTRTYHRLTCAIEDAGWEVRDCLSWLYGSGFPKSRDIGKDFDKGVRPVVGVQQAPGHAKANVEQGAQTRTHTEFPKYDTEPVTDLARQWQGWGTALKPAWEPIILARKPLVGTVAANVLEHGTGALNIDGCRIEGDEKKSAGSHRALSHDGANGRPYHERESTREPFDRAAGRWPANVCLDEDAAALLDAQSGEQRARGNKGASIGGGGMYGHGACINTFGSGDAGGASRFFYCAKASRRERNAGLDGLPVSRVGMMQDDAYEWKGTATNAPHKTPPAPNHHPTVKPLALMRWLCRLVTPPGGLILDPFTGSGSTGCAAVAEGFRFLGIELNEQYAAIARARITRHVPEQFGLSIDDAGR